MANDICLECDAVMPHGEYQQCPTCNGEHLISADKLNPEDLTEEQKQVIIAQDNEKREQRAAKELEAKHVAHPITPDGELDMTDARNNPLIPSGKKPKPEKDDMTNPANNPLLPDSTAKTDFGKEEKELDMTNPKNNPLIPK